MPDSFRFLCWFAIYVVTTIADGFIGLKSPVILGSLIVSTVLCTVVVFIFTWSCLSRYDLANVIAWHFYRSGFPTWGEESTNGILRALPFGLSIFDGIDQICVMSAYKSSEKREDDPESWKRPVAQAMQAAYITNFSIFFLSIIAASGGISNPSGIWDSDTPILYGFNQVFGSKAAISGIAAFAIVVGTLANIFVISHFNSELIAALAENDVFKISGSRFGSK